MKNKTHDANLLSKQAIWMGMTKKDILARRRLNMSSTAKLAILQDAAKNMWCKHFMTPRQLVDLLARLACPFAEGEDITEICMDKTLNTIAGLVVEQNLGPGLWCDIDEGFSLTKSLRNRILSSTTLAEAIDVPALEDKEQRKYLVTDIAHLPKARLMRDALRLIKEEGHFHRGRKTKASVNSASNGMSHKSIDEMISLLKRTSSDRANGMLQTKFGLTLDDIISKGFHPFIFTGESDSDVDVDCSDQSEESSGESS
ncbi:hypothetical protein TI39_contig4341g00002 [Zymoseptoria brevis]|uniref:Uncharacterized protein n=1 Tax=Zymoseptoria brevis TaxID=1047168 RepID=A0A0F4G7I0_9PEZI|nr:hypothetical protein TI39_contig4341g00002 [Zymoseptoria brevis]